MRKRERSLPSNEADQLVVKTLRRSSRPLTAYELLERLRTRGFSAPPTIYRALHRLVERGLIHRLESINAFVVCSNASHAHAATFAICEACESATELHDLEAVEHLSVSASSANFTVRKMVLEIRGLCATCSKGGEFSGAEQVIATRPT